MASTDMRAPRGMTVEIPDDLDLRKIAESGQCFRVRSLEGGMYRFITGEHVLYIAPAGGGSYSVSCTPDEWHGVWEPYFDLGRDYRSLRAQIPPADEFLRKAAEEGAGIRILLQDHWETLLSFIISQRKSIPAIKGSIEMLCERFGHSIKTPYETVYTFPAPEEMAGITPEDLAACKTGYRAGYILDAVRRVLGHETDLSQLEALPDQELFDSLTSFYGVGKKVADCVCLFSYGRTGLAPVDTWIRKVIDTRYRGCDPFCAYGRAAGIMQQYLFYYALKHKDEFRE